MTSAVEQAGNQQVGGCFLAAYGASNWRVWLPGKLSAVATASNLPSFKTRQAATDLVERTRKYGSASESFWQSRQAEVMPHWMSSDQLYDIYTEGTGRSEMTPDVAPSTPMRPFLRQKAQNCEIPVSSCSLPSLSLGISLSEGQEGAVERPSQGTGALGSQPSHLQLLPARSVACVPSLPLKNLHRIQLEMQKEGPELHKENLLSLSLPKHEKQLLETGRPDPTLSLGHHAGQLPPQRSVKSLSYVETCLPLLLTQNTEGFHCGSSLLPDSTPPQLPTLNKGRVKASSVPAFSGYSIFESGATNAKQSSVSAKAVTLGGSVVGQGLINHVSQESSLEIKPSPSSMDSQCFFKIYSDVPPPLCAPNRACAATSCSPVKQELSSDNGVPKECAKYVQLLRHAPGVLVQEQQAGNRNAQGPVNCHDSVCFGKRHKSLALQNEMASQKLQMKGEFHVLCDDNPPYTRVARKTTRKKKEAAEQLMVSDSVVGATDKIAQSYGRPFQISPMTSPMNVSYLSEHTRENGEYDNPIASIWGGSMERNGEHIRTSCQGKLNVEQMPQTISTLIALRSVAETDMSSTPNTRHSEETPSVYLEEVNAKPCALKPFTTPAYAQLPKALATFSAGEALLPLSLELSEKPPVAVAGKTPFNVDSSTDADWGKYLALSATPVGNTIDTFTDNMLPFQHRFKKLQAFLKQCDESDQGDCLQALRSLSAAARSGHAVDLESRAIRLSLEEGKEMKRMRLLNVLNRIPDRNLDDAGTTPHGPRLPAPGVASNLKQGS